MLKKLKYYISFFIDTPIYIGVSDTVTNGKQNKPFASKLTAKCRIKKPDALYEVVSVIRDKKTGEIKYKLMDVETSFELIVNKRIFDRLFERS